MHALRRAGVATLCLVLSFNIDAKSYHPLSVHHTTHIDLSPSSDSDETHAVIALVFPLRAVALEILMDACARAKRWDLIEGYLWKSVNRLQMQVRASFTMRLEIQVFVFLQCEVNTAILLLTAQGKAAYPEID